MTTLLEKTIKRELKVGSKHYVVTLSPQSLKITLKGRRNGVELNWSELISGDAALAVALNASLGKLQEDAPKSVNMVARKRRGYAASK